MTKSERRAIDQVFIIMGIMLTIVLVGASVLTFYGYHFATTQVHNELVAQKIYFPEAGSAEFSRDEYPGLQQYAGQQVDTGTEAKAYANEYIAHHLDKIADGKTYAEVSDAYLKDPTNQKLQTQRQLLFQGETLRGLLLNSYAFWTFGMIAYVAALAAMIGAFIMAILVLLGVRHLQKLK